VRNLVHAVGEKPVWYSGGEWPRRKGKEKGQEQVRDQDAESIETVWGTGRGQHVWGVRVNLGGWY